MGFVHLHAHDSYSFLDGAMSTKTMVSRAKELGQQAIAQTNHGNMHGSLKFYKECKEQHIKPILGIEFYLAPNNRSERSGDQKSAYSHITALAMSNKGLKNLFKLTSLSYSEGFYYRPRIDLEILEKYNEGIILLSGCLQGAIQQFLLADDRTSAAKTLSRKLQKVFGDRFYLELQRIIPEQEVVVRKQLKLASDLGIRCVTTCDAHYVLPGDAEFQAQLVALATNRSINDEKFRGVYRGLYLKSEQEMLELFRDIPAAVHETQRIADRCNITLLDNKVSHFPRFGDNDKELFISKARKGLNDRGLGKEPEYRQRLEYELNTIIEMGFSSYFLVVADYCHWAREHDIMVGPGRGSAGGSLVAYSLGITNLDPIKYGLIFSRFLNSGRKDSFPDIDLDFDIERRSDVLDYLSKKYGVENVAQMATFAEFKPRGAIRDFARAQGAPYVLGEHGAKLIPPDVRGHAPTWKELRKNCPELWQGELRPVAEMAANSDGMVKQVGIHAAGVVISPAPLTEYIPLFTRDNQAVTQWDMKDVESIGLVKMDLLGLKTLTIMARCIALIKQQHNIVINLAEIPLDDPKAYDTIGSGDTNGIFQLDTGGGIRDLARKLQPQSIEELAQLTALFRPGPLDLGLTGSFIRRKQGKEEVAYRTPKLEPILKPTYGVMVFQEQAMKIATDLAGYTLEEADNLRKAIGKKKREEMALHEKKLIQGLITTSHIEEATARDIFNDIKGFADYGFNKAHAVAYSIITYQTAWLKAHYPMEFYCALLAMHTNERDKTMDYLADCKSKDIQILPPDINASEPNFTIANGVIRFGFAGIKGMGKKVCPELTRIRKEGGPFKDFMDFYNRTRGAKINKKSIEALALAGAFDSLDINRSAVLEVTEKLGIYSKKLKAYESKMATYTKRLVKWQQREEEIRIAILEHRKPKNSLKPPQKPEEPVSVEIPQTTEIPIDQLLATEREMLGVYVSSHPLYAYNHEILTLTDAHTASLIDHYQGDKVTLLGIITSTRHFVTKKGTPMATFVLEDLNGSIKVTVFTRVYEKVKSAIHQGNVIVVNGRVDAEEETRKLIALDIIVLPPKPLAFINDNDSPSKPKAISLGKLKNLNLESLSDIVNSYPGEIEIAPSVIIGEERYQLRSCCKLSQLGVKRLEILGYNTEGD